MPNRERCCVSKFGLFENCCDRKPVAGIWWLCWAGSGGVASLKMWTFPS
jgi:hypothetical protein